MAKHFWKRDQSVQGLKATKSFKFKEQKGQCGWNVVSKGDSGRRSLTDRRELDGVRLNH